MTFGNAIRTTLIAVVTIAGAVVVAAPPASADTGTTNQSGFDVAYVSRGMLEVWGCTWPHGNALGGCGPVLQNTPAVAPNTSPSIMKVGTNGYEVAYQAANGDLALTGSLGSGDQGRKMMAGTSPAITSVFTNLLFGAYEIAFQTDTGQLSTVGTAANIDWGLPMDHASSPSIATVGTTSFEVAYATNTDSLAYAGAAGTGVQSVGAVKPGTSPSITTDPATGGWDIAFQGNCPQGVLNILALTNGNQPFSCAGDGMSPGSSPSITNTPTPPNPVDDIEVAFNDLDGRVFGRGSQLSGPVTNPPNPNGIQIAPGSSPAVIATTLPAYLGAGTAPGFEMFFTTPSGDLRYVLGSAFTSVYLNPASRINAIDPGTNPSVISFQ